MSKDSSVSCLTLYKSTKFGLCQNESIDEKVKVAQKMMSVSERVQNIVSKTENAGFQHFLLCPQCFQKASMMVVGIVWLKS